LVCKQVPNGSRGGAVRCHSASVSPYRKPGVRQAQCSVASRSLSGPQRIQTHLLVAPPSWPLRWHCSRCRPERNTEADQPFLEPPPAIQAAAQRLPFARTPGPATMPHQAGALDINSRLAQHRRIRCHGQHAAQGTANLPWAEHCCTCPAHTCCCCCKVVPCQQKQSQRSYTPVLAAQGQARLPEGKGG
jgi:hypothetical protein